MDWIDSCIFLGTSKAHEKVIHRLVEVINQLHLYETNELFLI